MSTKLIKDSFEKDLKSADFTPQDDFGKEKQANELRLSSPSKTRSRKMPRQSGQGKETSLPDMWDVPGRRGPLEDEG